MSMSTTIAPHLPYLRRFARALAGTQGAGDAYVAATLEVLIEDPSLFDASLDPRVALYRTFLNLWNSVDLNLKPEVATVSLTAVDRKLESITPLPRQAFLLCSVEGFSVAEAAIILVVDIARGRRADRHGGARDRRASGDRRADHRGRADDRHGPRKHRRGPRPSRHRRRAHPCRGGQGRAQAEAGPRARRHPARRRQLRPRRGQRDARLVRRCR